LAFIILALDGIPLGKIIRISLVVNRIIDDFAGVMIAQLIHNCDETNGLMIDDFRFVHAFRQKIHTFQLDCSNYSSARVYEKRSILKCNIGYRFEAVRGGQRGKRKDLEVLMGRKLKFC
jgi:hypothetical protein